MGRLLPIIDQGNLQMFWPGLEGTFLIYSFFSAGSFQDGGAEHKFWESYEVQRPDSGWSRVAVCAPSPGKVKEIWLQHLPDTELNAADQARSEELQ